MKICFSRINLREKKLCQSRPWLAFVSGFYHFNRLNLTSFVPILLFEAVWQGHGARHILARVLTVCGSTRYVAQATSLLWTSARKVNGGSTTASTSRMQECPAAHSQVGQHLHGVNIKIKN